MFRFIFFVSILFQASVFFADGQQVIPVCPCYERCVSNYTTNGLQDVSRIEACKRGCNFFAIAAYVSHEVHDVNAEVDVRYSFTSCVYSCHKAYKVKGENEACVVGCGQFHDGPCHTPAWEKKNIAGTLIHGPDFTLAEVDPDDVMTDPILRNQIAKPLAALTETKAKLPEIHFMDLPVKKEEESAKNHVHTSMKCPKLYGLDSKMEFRNVKVLVGDLYLFAGIFIFVILCFLIGYQIDTNNVRRQLKKTKRSKDKKESGNEKERLLKEVINYNADYIMDKSELMRNTGAVPKFTRSITLVFNDASTPSQCVGSNRKSYNNLLFAQKLAVADSDKFDTIIEMGDDYDPNAYTKEQKTYEIV